MTMNFKREYEYKNALRELFSELFSDEALICIPESDESIETALEFSEEVTQYEESMWASFLNEMQRYNTEVQTSYNSEEEMLILRLSEDFFNPTFYNDLQICFSLTTYSYEKFKEEFDFCELDGMSREEAIDYLSKSVGISDDVGAPEVEYLQISSSSLFESFELYAAVRPLPNTTEMASLINHVNESLLKIPEVLAKVDEKIKSQEDEEKKKEEAIKDIEELLRPTLIDAGWEGEFCVIHFTKDLYKLFLRTGYSSAYNYLGTLTQIIEHVPILIKNAEMYKDLMNRLSELSEQGFGIVRSDQIQSMKWSK